MLDLFNIAKPQGCDIQTFYGTGYTASSTQSFGWNKPRGVSHVYMLLIGGGGSGDGSTGGGSAAVTVWYGAAQHVPDMLKIYAAYGGTSGGVGGANSSVYMPSRSSEILLLEAQGGATGTAGSAMSANYFTASGFFQSVAGQNGSSSGQSASTTTFLGAGGGAANTGNYGYTVADNKTGYFQMRPIIVGVGSSASDSGVAGIGCGGGYTTSGGPGMVLIASW